jgi:exosortase/archaeosortase family protein
VLVEYLKRPRFLIGFLLILGGFDIGMSFTYLPRLLGIILVLIGIILISVELKARKKKTESKEETALRKRTAEPIAPRLSNRLIQKLTLGGRLLPYLWIIGLIVIVGDVALNAFIQKSEIGGNDMMVLFFGVSLIIYDPPPWMRFGTYLKKYTREKDFIVVFLGLLVLILVLPIYVNALLIGGTQGDSPGLDRSNDNIVFVLLTAPLSGILSVLGLENHAVGAFLEFKMADGNSATIGIAATCAGIYSFGIFLAAFIAFVLSEYSRLTKRIGILLIIGSMLTYLANLLRMTFIVLAGYYNGIGDMNDPAPFTLLWTHKYAGEIIFISWVAVFWWIAFRYLAVDERETSAQGMSFPKERKTDPPIDKASTNTELNRKIIEVRKGKVA